MVRQMPENQRPRDSIRQLAELLRFYEGETRSIEALADEVGMEWGEVYNYLLLIEDLQALAPDVDYDDGEVTVGESQHQTPELYESETMAVLAYLFVQTKTVDPINMEAHAAFFDDHEDGVEEALDHGFVEQEEDGSLALTPEGIGLIGPEYSRCINGRYQE